MTCVQVFRELLDKALRSADARQLSGQGSSSLAPVKPFGGHSKTLRTTLTKQRLKEDERK